MVGLMSANITYSQLEREACKAAKLAKCVAQRATCLAALQEKRRGPPSELVEAMKIVEGCLREHASCASVCPHHTLPSLLCLSAVLCGCVQNNEFGDAVAVWSSVLNSCH